jgi:hypothetical protein
MNRHVIVAAAALALNLASALPASALTPGDRARAAAAESPTALRHFVHRTRMIYMLDFNDFIGAARDKTAQLAGTDWAPDEDEQERNARLFEELRAQILHDIELE